MTRENAKGVAVFVTIVIGMVVLFSLVLSCVGDRTAGAKCYENFRNTYTYPGAQSALDEIWADKRITQAECVQIDLIYKNAQLAEDTLATEKAIKEYRP